MDNNETPKLVKEWRFRGSEELPEVSGRFKLHRLCSDDDDVIVGYFHHLSTGEKWTVFYAAADSEDP